MTTDTLASPPAGVRGRAVLTGTAAAIVLAACIVVALRTASGQQFDHWAMTTVVAGRDAHLAVLSVLGYVSIGALALAASGSVALALLRRQVRLALAALLVIGGANATTQVLKQYVLERAELADGIIAHNSLPSGHTTVVASSLGALCLVCPTWLRPFVMTAGSCAVTLTGAATVVAGWHRPSDVIAAVLVCLIWTAIAALVVGGALRPGLAGFTAAIVGAAAAIIFLIVIGVRPSAGWDAFATAALVLGSIALLTAVVTATMDRVSPAH
ncbi:MAG: phosphatase PAP2 family protein [Aeromicrobium sp.]|uniref:phosphatase PAP2 family protein n=1 Tax=Aeromicrobium sp. TaxID=1871063 RepID=UPI0039E52E39